MTIADRDPLLLETTVQALLARYAGTGVAMEDAYADTAVDIAFHRASRTEDSAAALARSVDELLREIDAAGDGMPHYADYFEAKAAVAPYLA